jgi:hypothetical protein
VQQFHSDDAPERLSPLPDISGEKESWLGVSDAIAFALPRVLTSQSVYSVRGRLAGGCTLSLGEPLVFLTNRCVFTSAAPPVDDVPIFPRYPALAISRLSEGEGGMTKGRGF